MTTTRKFMLCALSWLSTSVPAQARATEIVDASMPATPVVVRIETQINHVRMSCYEPCVNDCCVTSGGFTSASPAFTLR
jgi:hypothetical protein